MMKKIKTNVLTAGTKNELFAKGFRFYCDGNFRVTDKIDPKTGHLIIEHNILVFDNMEEAKTYAKKVYNIPKHTETDDEYEKRVEKEKEAKKEKKEAKIKKEAEKMNLTVEGYKKYVNVKRNLAKHEKALEYFKRMLEEEEAKVKYYEKEKNKYENRD